MIFTWPFLFSSGAIFLKCINFFIDGWFSLSTACNRWGILLKFFPLEICVVLAAQFIIVVSIDSNDLRPDTFFYSDIAARALWYPPVFVGFFEHGGSAGVRLSKIICESNFRRHPWNYELSDELFSWIDFPFVLSAENEYEGAILNGGIIPWHQIFLITSIWTTFISNS